MKAVHQGIAQQPYFAGGFTPLRRGVLQRKCACGGTPGPQGECESCRKNSLQRKSEDSQARTRNDRAFPPIVHEVLRSQDQPLDPETRAFMEPRFGHDFSRVRVHADGRGAESAKVVQALAYTVGQDVVFGAAQYAPNTGTGRRLIAHELAHVVQQQAGVHLSSEVSEAGDPLERHADQVAEAVAEGRSARNFLDAYPSSADRQTGNALQRQSEATKPESAQVVADEKPTGSSDPLVLAEAVGVGGVNRADDVAKVQARLLALGLLSEEDFVAESPVATMAIPPENARDIGTADSTSLTTPLVTIPPDSTATIPEDSLSHTVSIADPTVAANVPAAEAKTEGAQPDVIAESSLTATIAAIREFQRTLFNKETVDGNIGVSGPTWRGLIKADKTSFARMKEASEERKQRMKEEKERREQDRARKKAEEAREVKEEATRKKIELERNDQEADKKSTATAQKLLVVYATYLPFTSTYVNLDEAGLARVLSIYAKFDGELVLKVFDAIQESDADDVAYEMASNATGEELAKFDRAVLKRMKLALATGVAFTSEAAQVARINVALGVKPRDAKGKAADTKAADTKAADAADSGAKTPAAPGALLWPLDTANSAVSSCFGLRTVTKKGKKVTENHPGLDIGQEKGYPVYAAAAGEVILAGPVGGYGPNYVAIKHSDTLLTGYGHMSSKSVTSHKLHSKEAGETVTAGQKIGEVGHEGISIGNPGDHLHFNVTVGKNPSDHNVWNGNVDPLQNGLTIPSGVSNPKKCK